MDLRELNIRLDDEYQAIIKEGIKYANKHNQEPYLYFINHAYEMAHCNEIIDLFYYMEEADFESMFQKDLEKLSPSTNILHRILISWFNQDHPEQFNFFCYEDLIDIIKDAIA